MSLITQSGVNVLFGRAPALPVQLPKGAIGHKIKSRQGEFARIFVRFPDRIEEWHLAQKDGALYPGLLKAVNHRHQHRRSQIALGRKRKLCLE